VIDSRRSRTRTAWIFGLIGLIPVLAAPRSAATGQDAPAQPATGMADQVVARLKSACESDADLRGALIQRGELEDATLMLSGTIDRAGQAGRIEVEARRLLAASPSWKARISGGVSAAKLIVFPVRSELVPRLRHDFAGANSGPKALPGLLQQTRIDDLYFDATGRARVIGLCINHGAYLTHKDAAASPVDDPLARIAQAIRDRLKSYPLPDGVAPNVLARLQADQIRFEENPVRRLQRVANGSAQLDDVLFRDARFGADGALLLDGLLGDESQRAEAAALLSRAEFIKTYCQPGGKLATDPRAAVAPMVVVPWRKALLTSLQERFARDANRAGPMVDVRYCRVDRAVFVYLEQGGLLLRFEGVALRSDDEMMSARIATALRDETRRLFVPPIRVEFNIAERLTRLPNPVRRLQANVAANPALDGVRLDDLTFGPKGEATFEGLWVGPAQAAALTAVLTTALADQTRGKIAGPLAWRLVGTPTDQWLRELRGKVAAEFDETSLDRLVFRPAADLKAAPGLILQGATSADRRGEVEARLGTWLKESELVKAVSMPVIQLTSRPKSLMVELRKLVASDPTLDGVRVDHGRFDQDNCFVLSGLQDRDGQAERLVALTRAAAAAAWPNLPPPAAARAGPFQNFSLRELLSNLSRNLPRFPEADRVVLDRAYWDADAALMLAGRTTAPVGDHQELERVIRALIRAESSLIVRLSLTPQRADRDVVDRIVVRGVAALAGGNIARMALDELNQAILFDPTESTAWYLRAAYYDSVGDRELARRDFRRVHEVEAMVKSRFVNRNIWLTPFQGALRARLDEMVRNARD
jgi:hypothetical protein